MSAGEDNELLAPAPGLSADAAGAAPARGPSALRAVFGQSAALAGAEWLRLLTNPVWAVLVVLWSAVCALFFEVVLSRAAAAPLPPGESAMSAFFRAAPGVLPLLLVVFVPQLAMDAIAGRRERGRLEQLGAGGLRPIALVSGSYLALLGLLLALLLPPLALHLLLSGSGEADAGHTAAALLALLLQSATLAALACCCSAWAPGRMSAGLLAAAIGVSWWIVDFFAPVLGQDGLLGEVLGLIGLGQILHAWAGGLIEWRGVLAFLSITVVLLALTRIGLLWRLAPLPRLLTAGCWVLLGAALLVPINGIGGSIDLSRRSYTSVDDESATLCQTLAEQGGVEAVLVASTAMRNDSVDGPMVEALIRHLTQLREYGLEWRMLDPERSPASIAELRREQRLGDADFARPLLLLEHLDRHESVPATVLGLRIDEASGPRLAALDIRQAVLVALRRLSGELPEIAWMSAGARELDATLPHRRDQAMGGWARMLAAEGYRVHPLQDWGRAQGRDWNLIVLPGPQRDLDEQALAVLEAHLAAGGHLLLALDAAVQDSMPRLSGLLADYGLAWGLGVLRPEPDAAAELRLRCDTGDGPLALAAQESAELVLVDNAPLRLELPEDPRRTVQRLLPSPPGSLLDAGADPLPLRRPRPLLAISTAEGGSRIALLAGCASLSDGHIDRSGNRLLALGLARWLCRGDQQMHSGGTELRAERIHLTPSTLALLRWGGGVGLPLLALAAGLGTWWWRRRP